MRRSLRFRFVLVLAVVLLCVYGIIGIPTSARTAVANIRKHIHLGLDLKGGSQLVLQVQLQDAFKADADNAINTLKQKLQSAGIGYRAIYRNDPQSIDQAASIEVNVQGIPSTRSGDFQNMVRRSIGSEWILNSISLTDYRLTMQPAFAAKLKQETLTQTMNVIERKINGLGLSEASVQQHGGTGGSQAGELLVQLPGVSDPGRIKQILKTAAVLDLKQVLAGPFGSRDEALASHGGILPFGSEVLGNGISGQGGEYWILDRAPVITGKDLRDARAIRGPMNGWQTEFFLSQAAAKTFQRFTGSHIGRRLAIVLDNVVLSAPVIQSQIGDSGVIQGLSGRQEASDLALNLRSGSLPAGVQYLEENTVGPSLGADSIHEGIASGVAGILAVIVALLVYYRRSGINAVLALILNGIILVAVLSYAGAVLTLPGMAGIILTVGMAVDANVLIFERIREELRAGKSVLAAVDNGFRHAFRTIIDTHVTTMVSCAFLFLFGAGPVRGFAVTLLIGLAANVFTAVFVSRLIFDWELSHRRRVTSFSI